jgi:hypothetical protein
MATPKTGDVQPQRGPLTPNPDLAKTTGAKGGKGGKIVKGTATPTKRG